MKPEGCSNSKKKWRKNRFKWKKKDQRYPGPPNKMVPFEEGMNFENSFWLNYSRVMKWQQMHLAGYWRSHALKLEAENKSLREELFSRDRGLEKVEREDFEDSETGFETSETVDQMSCDGTNVEPPQEYASESDPEFEVSPEFQELIAISMKHKEEMRRIKEEANKGVPCDKPNTKRKKGKKKKKKKNSKSRSDASESSAVAEVFKAPTEAVGRRRWEELKLLYGSHAPKIQGMETAVQLAFAKKCDQYSPVFWPHVPLNA